MLPAREPDKCDESPTNELELRVYGLMRSGNHAIIEWILGLFPGEKTCFLNNVDHGQNDPYSSARKSIIGGFDSADPQQCQREAKKVLIYSYEDRKHLQKTGTPFLDSVFDPAFESSREDFLGPSLRRRDVLILRDPFNCFASRMAMIQDRGANGGMRQLPEIAQNWKALARRALQLADGHAETEMVILFNEWIRSRDYRERIASALGGQYCEANMHRISRFGGGSSFTPNRSYRRWSGGRFFHYLQQWIVPGRQHAEMLTHRWKNLRDNESFRSLFRDPEILQLSEALFGEVPGTRKFVRTIISEFKHLAQA